MEDLPTEGMENIPVELIHDYVKSKQDEIFLKRQELDLAKQQDENTYNYACKLLDLQAKDRSEIRKQSTDSLNKLLITIGVFAVFFILFCWMLLYFNQFELLYDLLKALVVAVPTGFGGFYMGKQREKKKNIDDLENN
ncbi:hypothetical protein MWN41_09240 [Ornithobacterium rhinotracheale]|uniref:hypothetical protein n=1 Tax=Ornithobacterium rhinotracheale TaxID=28251 RepID=UPI001FF1D344|nr:hypothetical protein [Ornithobacterium rhinotracheale]MCK0203194.1 hypothetical protein [Ornithobacterium rhinotracheale]